MAVKPNAIIIQVFATITNSFASTNTPLFLDRHRSESSKWLPVYGEFLCGAVAGFSFHCITHKENAGKSQSDDKTATDNVVSLDQTGKHNL